LILDQYQIEDLLSYLIYEMKQPSLQRIWGIGMEVEVKQEEAESLQRVPVEGPGGIE
jgi:hypothetical protein